MRNEIHYLVVTRRDYARTVNHSPSHSPKVANFDGVKRSVKLISQLGGVTGTRDHSMKYRGVTQIYQIFRLTNHTGALTTMVVVFSGLNVGVWDYVRVFDRRRTRDETNTNSYIHPTYNRHSLSHSPFFLYHTHVGISGFSHSPHSLIVSTTNH